MNKKLKQESENFLVQNEFKFDKRNIFSRKPSTNSNHQKENQIFGSKLMHLEPNNNLSNHHNIRTKNNLSLLPIKKTRSKKENEINTFSLFFNGESNFVSSKNEVNLITTQYNYGNNQLLIHKVSKDFSSKKKIKGHFLNSINSNTIKDEIQEKLNTHLNAGEKYNKKSKRALILNNLKNRKKIMSDLKNIKEIRERIYEGPPPPSQYNLENNNINLNKIGNNISLKKLPDLYTIKNNNINLINYLSIPRNKLITPILKNNNNYIRKKSEIIKRKKLKKLNKEKEDREINFGHKIQWKKICTIKEGENCNIYKAFNISNGYVFIVKEYKINNKESRKNKKLFYNEVKFLKNNRQKNIVEYIDAEVIDNSYFYIYLNFIGGYNLNEFYSKVGFFTKCLLKNFIEQLIFFMDYMKLKGFVYNNFSFSHLMFDLDGIIKIIDFSKVISQNDIIKKNFVRHNEDVDFFKFKDVILNIIYFEKSNNIKNNEISSDISNFCNFLEASINNASSLFEFKSNYFFKDKEETIYMKNSSINIIS
jgi:hypothetical protein